MLSNVSRLRRQADEDGPRGLLPAMGRPRTLDALAVARVHELSGRGVTGREIAGKLGVSETMISRLLARRPAPAGDRLALGEIDAVSPSDTAEVADTGEIEPEVTDTGQVTGTGEIEPEVTGTAGVVDMGEIEPEMTGTGEVLGARIGEGGGRSVYAGAMLLHPFLDRVGAGGVLGVLDSGPERRYDTTALALAGTFAFALGTSSLEGAKHLQLQDAGMLVGIERFPHVRTLRPRLGALADRTDPLEVQVALAKAMLDLDAEPPSVFFVDEHFVAYTGSRPVAKGYNTRRRHAEPGRHETVIVDDRWRAVCFASGPPRASRVGCSARSTSCARSAASGR